MRILIVIIFIILSSCHFFGPIDNDVQTNNVNFQEIDIVGKWQLDKFSYQYLSKENVIDSIYIIFNSDYTFEINNSNKLFEVKSDSTIIDNFSNGIIDNSKTKGKWKIIENPSNKKIQLSIDDQVFSGLNIYRKGDNFHILYFYGDPDNGERLRFVK